MHLGKSVRSRAPHQFKSAKSSCSRQDAVQVAGNSDQCLVSGLHESHLPELRGLAGFVDALWPCLEGSIPPDCHASIGGQTAVFQPRSSPREPGLKLAAAWAPVFRPPTSSILCQSSCAEALGRLLMSKATRIPCREVSNIFNGCRQCRRPLKAAPVYLGFGL